jgi:hypothetical protein
MSNREVKLGGKKQSNATTGVASSQVRDLSLVEQVVHSAELQLFVVSICRETRILPHRERWRQSGVWYGFG